MDRIEIRPATVGQVARTRLGKNVAVDADVANVARDLRDISPEFRLEYDPHGDFFIVSQVRVMPDGSEEISLVTTAQDCDQRIVRRVREITAPGYDVGAEMERLDREADKRKEHALTERVGPIAEKLAWALRKDLGDKDRAFTTYDPSRRVA